MHFSAGAPQPTWSPSIPYCQPIQCALSRSSRTSKIREDTHTKYKHKISIPCGHGNKYCITTLSFPADITESRIKKNENSLTAERWLFSQIKASRPFVGQYICHCILSPIVWIRKSAMYVLYVRLDVHIGVCSIVSPVYNARQRALTIGHSACSSSQDCFSVLRHA